MINNNNNNNNNNLKLFTHGCLSVSCFSKGLVKLWTTIYDTKLQTDNITIQKTIVWYYYPGSVAYIIDHSLKGFDSDFI